jgi:hypothetical protein
MTGTVWSVANAISWTGLLNPTGNARGAYNLQAAARYLLSLYALTVRDNIPNTGDWSEIQIASGVNDAAHANDSNFGDKLKIKQALFGDGQQANSLIQHLWFGMDGPKSNTYPQVTFTVSGLNLKTNSIEQNGVFTAAPQDAFEVALQNANTGANLLANGPGNLGTSRSDALLNLQLASSSAAATLQERAVSGLRHTDNVDGSRTYVLDLSGIAAGNGGSNAGVAVNLSFDLIGFGLTASQLGSKVNISDVRLISTPMAVNDVGTLAEDGSTAITVQANDLNADVTDPQIGAQPICNGRH